MQSHSDKLLWGIVGGILLILGASLLYILQPQTPITYRTGEDPADVVYNYLTAIQLDDMEQAYGYVSPNVEYYPANTAEFWADVENGACPVSAERAYLDEISKVTTRDTIAIVKATTTIYRAQNSFFFHNDSYQMVNSFTLEQAHGRWYIAYGEQCWSSCWNNNNAHFCR